MYQPVLGPDSRLTVTGTGTPLADLKVGPDFHPLPVSSDQPVTGPLVFAGHGISAPELRHDDYARIDARGAIVLVLDDAPAALRRMPALSNDAAMNRDPANARQWTRESTAQSGSSWCGPYSATSVESGRTTRLSAPPHTGCSRRCVRRRSRSGPSRSRAAIPVRARARRRAAPHGGVHARRDRPGRPCVQCPRRDRRTAGRARDGRGRRSPRSRRDRRGWPHLQRRRRQRVGYRGRARDGIGVRPRRRAGHSSRAGDRVRTLER